MKKKTLVTLFAGTAILGASIAPAAAHATTTGTTPANVEMTSGSLPGGTGDGDDGSTQEPDCVRILTLICYMFQQNSNLLRQKLVLIYQRFRQMRQVPKQNVMVSGMFVEHKRVGQLLPALLK